MCTSGVQIGRLHAEDQLHVVARRTTPPRARTPCREDRCRAGSPWTAAAARTAGRSRRRSARSGRRSPRLRSVSAALAPASDAPTITNSLMLLTLFTQRLMPCLFTRVGHARPMPRIGQAGHLIDDHPQPLGIGRWRTGKSARTPRPSRRHRGRTRRDQLQQDLVLTLVSIGGARPPHHVAQRHALEQRTFGTGPARDGRARRRIGTPARCPPGAASHAAPRPRSGRSAPTSPT